MEDHVFLLHLFSFFFRTSAYFSFWKFLDAKFHATQKNNQIFRARWYKKSLWASRPIGYRPRFWHSCISRIRGYSFMRIESPRNQEICDQRNFCFVQSRKWSHSFDRDELPTIQKLRIWKILPCNLFQSGNKPKNMAYYGHKHQKVSWKIGLYISQLNCALNMNPARFALTETDFRSC